LRYVKKKLFSTIQDELIKKSMRLIWPGTDKFRFLFRHKKKKKSFMTRYIFVTILISYTDMSLFYFLQDKDLSLKSV